MNMINEQFDIQSTDRGFEALFDLSPVPMLVSHAQDFQLLAANQAALKLYGLEREALLNMSLQELRHPDEQARFTSELDKPLPPGELKRSIWLHQSQDGTTLSLECVTRVVEFESRPAHLTVLRDITMERRAIQSMETSERRFRDLFQHTLGFICIHDMDGVLLSVNPAAAKSLGYSVGELLGSSLRDLIPEERHENFPGYLQRLRDHGSDRGLLVLRHKNGNLRTWQYNNRVYEDGESHTSVMSSAQDITDLRAAEDAARHSERRIRMITDALPLRVAYVDADMRFEFVNGLYERLYGRHRDHIVGKRLDEILDHETLKARMPYLQRALSGHSQHFEAERTDSRQLCCDEISFLPDFAADGHTVLGIYVMAQDITQQKQEEQRLVELAQVDSLTGLLNRSGVMNRLGRALERSHDQNSSLALMYMDLDGFKQVNDQHGHGVGDWVLQTVAKRLQGTARGSDALGRLGGDEFVLIMEGVPDSESVTQTAQRIVDSMAEAFAAPGVAGASAIRIGVSMGIAIHEGTSENAADFLNRADEALYKAKHGGRGNWQLAEA